MDIKVSDYDIKNAIENAVKEEMVSHLKWHSDIKENVSLAVRQSMKGTDLSFVPDAVESYVKYYIESDEFKKAIVDHINSEMKSSFHNAFKGAVKQVAVSFGKRTADSIIKEHPVFAPYLMPDQD